LTDDTGTVVYAAAHDPFGGIQKVWKDDFDPKRKFSAKERHGETGLVYFGARYYSSPNWSEGHSSGSYRWLSTDPVLDTDKAIVEPQSWNLYTFCRNNSETNIDIDGKLAFAIGAAVAMAANALRHYYDAWLSLKIALAAAIKQWTGTPYMLTAGDIQIHVKADCGGLVFGVYRDAGYLYIFKGPSLAYNGKYNFPRSVEEGGVNEHNFKKLGKNEGLIYGDIIVWDGKHMGIYVGKEGNHDMVFSACPNYGAVTFPVESTIKDSPPTGYYRWRF
jgi:RHS repeat-associated protein